MLNWAANSVLAPNPAAAPSPAWAYSSTHARGTTTVLTAPLATPTPGVDGDGGKKRRAAIIVTRRKHKQGRSAGEVAVNLRRGLCALRALSPAMKLPGPQTKV